MDDTLYISFNVDYEEFLRVLSMSDLRKEATALGIRGVVRLNKKELLDAVIKRSLIQEASLLDSLLD